MKRLNLGCGSDIRPKEEGWVNLDARALPGVDIMMNLIHPYWAADVLYCSPGYFDEILAQDLIEHLPPAAVPMFLGNCYSLLASGGVLKLRYPDLLKIYRRAISSGLSEDEAVLLLYGDQSEEAGGTAWGGHKWGYPDSLMRTLLGQAGFMDITIEGHASEHNKYTEARKP